MSDVIKLLPDAIANQIAAGEVVQRPGSVVKELLENAIDAGSTEITLVVKEAGKSLVQVVDNGVGMSDSDAKMCLERHATSKIRKAEDLFSLTTMGFRGEAMASIAAVAQVEIKTCTADSPIGTNLVVEASEVKKQEPEALTPGTSISVKNLFYNIPARRNFLKSNPVELKHIIDEFQRVALANCNVGFKMYQNDLETYHLTPGKLSHRIVQMFGKNHKAQLASCQEDTTHVKVQGYIGKPEFSKKTRGEQFFFVNNRFIKSSYLNHAVTNAYEGLMPEGNFPFYVLFLEINPAHIDVNVHPTKTEIKFEDERTIYGVVKAAVKQALATHNIIPSLDFDLDVNFSLGANNQPQGHLKIPSSANTLNKKDRAYSNFSAFDSNKDNSTGWEKLYEGMDNSRLQTKSNEDSDTYEIKLESSVNREDPVASDPLVETDNKPSFQLHNKYIVAQVRAGMMIIDQQCAHERILFEKYLKNLENKTGASQQCLFPQHIPFNPGDFTLIMGLQDEMNALGFQYESFGQNKIVINGVPANFSGLNEKELFEGLIEQFKLNKNKLSLPNTENLARVMAVRSAIRHGQPLSDTERKEMIEQLFACSNPNYTPRGKMIYKLMSTDFISRYFE